MGRGGSEARRRRVRHFRIAPARESPTVLSLAIPGDINADLLVEVDRTQKPARNLDKFKRYDQCLTGWGLLHPRVEQLGTRPVLIYTSRRALDARAHESRRRNHDGRIGWSGEPEHAWYYPGRDHVLFTTEPEIHCGSMLAWRLREFRSRCAMRSATKASR